MAEEAVWVYQYRYWDAAADTFVLSRDWATLDAIKNGLGIAVLETARKVPARMVKQNGHVDAETAT